MHSDKDPSNAQIDTKSLHQQNLADELKTIRVDNEEHPEIMSKPETATFMSWLESKGITIPNSQTTREVLDDPILFNMPLRPLLDKLGMSMEDARGIGMQLKEEITKVTGARFREYLTHIDWRSRLSSENLEVDELSSSEAMTQEEASAELFSILGSQDIKFAQGAVWNMATTKESKWVAKFIKAGNESDSEWVMREEMQQYREVLEVFGEDLLLEQVSVKLRDKQTPVLLQEKLDLIEWRPMGSFNQGVYEELQQSLSSHPDNPAILKSFLDKISLLESTKGLVLDFSGDNVVFQIDAQGRLAIKVIDYGCTKLSSEEPQRLEYLHSHADKLREFI